MIKLTALNKYFGSHHVLKDIDLTIEKGEVVVLLGPSGSGKSTMLRCINFLEQPSSGVIEIGDIKVDTSNAGKSEISALRMATAMVFQQYNLFRNMTVLENVMVGLTAVKKIRRQEAEMISREIIAKIGLEDSISYYPAHLSGGQQQRVSIARALALNPDVILFDEPTSALDPELVGEVLAAIKQVASEGNTMLIVTHEIDFAREVADKAVLIDGGVIVEQGEAERMFTAPKTERAKQFLERSIQPFVYEI